MLEQIEHGSEVIIERDDYRALALITQPKQSGRLITECIAPAKAYEQKLGYASVPDESFAQDVQAGIDSRHEPLRNPWDD